MRSSFADLCVVARSEDGSADVLTKGDTNPIDDRGLYNIATNDNEDNDNDNDKAMSKHRLWLDNSTIIGSPVWCVFCLMMCLRDV